MKKNERVFFVLSGIALLALFPLFLLQEKEVESSSPVQEVTSQLSNNAMEEKRLDWQRRKEALKIEDLKFYNYAKGITIISKEREGDFINLKLRNDYQKVVTAYVISIAKMTTHTETLTGADYNDVFLPGAIREQKYFLQPDVDKLGIGIHAVVFEDGTADGIQHFVNNIREYRSGMKIQREYSLALLKGILETNLVDIQSLKIQTPQISEDKQKELPYFFKRGFQDEQDRFHQLIQRIKTTDSKITKDELLNKRQIIMKVVEHYSKTLAQL
jgi:hypothetical protein